MSVKAKSKSKVKAVVQDLSETRARKKSKWTQFWDMHSGGSQKLDWAKVYIEAPEDEARSVFYARFGRDPDCVTCTCCGEDYSVSEAESLTQATGFHRALRYAESEKHGSKGTWDRDHIYLEPGQRVPKGFRLKKENYDKLPEEERAKYPNGLTLEAYVAEDQKKEWGGGALLIFAEEIQPSERTTEVRRSGYVWQD